MGSHAGIAGVCAAGLCARCGTCAAVCARGAIAASWSVSVGWTMRVDESLCNDCGACLAVCPGPGCDFSSGAWWRDDNDGAPYVDFLGPWRGLFTGWAADSQTRYLGASGGFATAILQGALAKGLIDAAIVCRMDPTNPLRAQPVVARSAEEIAACRGSKYNVVATNLLLRDVIDTPGRYALVGLPCHIQGFRQARERIRALRERVVFSMGIFCGWTATPRATEVEALRAGLDPGELARVSYRGPHWPGSLRLETSTGVAREAAFPAYFYRLVRSCAPIRCRLCADGMAELADLSVGDAWLPRYDGSPGASDLVVRTERGQRVVDALGADWLTLFESTPQEIIQSQVATLEEKRNLYRGRSWLRTMARRAVTDYPGIAGRPSLRDRWLGVKDLAKEAHRPLEAVRFRTRG